MMKYFSDLKVGDEIYFSDNFCELDKVKVLEIRHALKNPRFFSIRVSDIEGDDGWFLVTMKGYKSHGFAARSKDGFLVGRLYTSIEAYKVSYSKDINNRLEQLIKDKDELEERIRVSREDLDKLDKL